MTALADQLTVTRVPDPDEQAMTLPSELPQEVPAETGGRDPGVGALDLSDRHALRRVSGLSTELQDVTEVEYRALRLERVILVGVWTEGTLADAENSLRELSRLAETAGSVILDALIQRRGRPDAATYIGAGKAAEVAALVAAAGADTVICDGELTPSQLRRLEGVVKAKVIDRTALILDIFAQHARSKEGKAQVELAQLEYLLPRLRGWGESLSRPAGWPAAAASAPGAPARRRSRRTGGGSGPAPPGCAASWPRCRSAARCSGTSAAATPSRRWPSRATPTRASPACSTG
jgi:GTP-binding protein HflX